MAILEAAPGANDTDAGARELAKLSALRRTKFLATAALAFASWCSR